MIYIYTRTIRFKISACSLASHHDGRNTPLHSQRAQNGTIDGKHIENKDKQAHSCPDIQASPRRERMKIDSLWARVSTAKTTPTSPTHLQDVFVIDKESYDWDSQPIQKQRY